MSDLLLEFIQCVRRADQVLSADVGLGPGVEEIADMLWLANQLPNPETDGSRLNETEFKQEEPEDSSLSDAAQDTVSGSNNPFLGNLPTRPQSPVAPPIGTLVTKGETAKRSPSSASTKPIKIPAAAALRHPLKLGRSLRRLIRKTDSRVRTVMDEEATAIAIAEDNPVGVIERPAQERWLDLEVVVEQSKVASIWEPTVKEWVELLERLGAFRTVRVWQLVSVKENEQWQPWLMLGRRSPTEDGPLPRSGKPKELVNAMGQCLVMVLSDCISPLWREGLIHEWLADWSKHGPSVIVQWFPSAYWSRTALKSGSKVWLSALSPGVPNHRLVPHYRGIAPEDWSPFAKRTKPSKAVVFPVVSLEPESLGTWARVVAGCGDAEIQGRRFKLMVQGQGNGQENEALKGDQRWLGPVKKVRPLPEAGEKRFLLFDEVASGLAKQLAGFMALGPVSPEITNLIQETLLPESGAVQVAEVFLSGLLEPIEGGSYRFVDGVQELLGKSMLKIDQTLVFEVLSEYISKRYQRTSREFIAFLEKHDWTDEQWDQAFESSGFAELRERLQEARLGGAGGDKDDLGEQEQPPQPVGVELEETAEASQKPGEQGTQEAEATVAKELEALIAGLSSEMVEDGVPRIVEVPGDPFEEPITVATVSIGSPSLLLEGLEIGEKSVDILRYVGEGSAAAEAEDIEDIEDEALPLETFPIRIARVVRKEPELLDRLRRRETMWTVEYKQAEAYRYVEQLPGSVTLELAAIPSGSFMMGSPDDEAEGYGDEQPQHQVTIAKGFFMGRYSVTQAQWRVVAGLPQVEKDLEVNPSRFDGDNRPVESVSWEDAMEFCRRLNVYADERSPEPRSYEYRLPSEAEWEYACRAGTTTPFYFGEMITPKVANYNDDYAYGDGPKGKSRGETTPVTAFNHANAFGLCDMHGNVWEWCQDHWHDDYRGAPSDGSARQEDPLHNNGRVSRGGAWFSSPRYCRSACRNLNSLVIRNDSLGFRVVLAPR